MSKLARIRSHVFRGRRWRIYWSKPPAGYAGACEDPRAPDKAMWFSGRLEGAEFLTTVIHEALHACVWDLDETTVEETARDITALLMRLGVEVPPRRRSA